MVLEGICQVVDSSRQLGHHFLFFASRKGAGVAFFWPCPIDAKTHEKINGYTDKSFNLRLRWAPRTPWQ